MRIVESASLTLSSTCVVLHTRAASVENFIPIVK